MSLSARRTRASPRWPSAAQVVVPLSFHTGAVGEWLQAIGAPKIKKILNKHFTI
jgi:uncharacterized protein YqcC (DUF446 family)